MVANNIIAMPFPTEEHLQARIKVLTKFRYGHITERRLEREMARIEQKRSKVSAERD